MSLSLKKGIVFLAPMLLAGLLLSACAGDEPTATHAPTPTGTPVVTKVSLALDWFPNSNHAGFYMALEKGYYRDEGLEVDIFVPANPEDVLKTVGAGRDDFGVSYQAGAGSERDRSRHRRMGRSQRRPGLPNDTFRPPVPHRPGICLYIHPIDYGHNAFRPGGPDRALCHALVSVGETG